MEDISKEIAGKTMQNKNFEIVVIGVSAGGMDALASVISKLPASFPLPVVIVQHLHPEQDGYMVEHFRRICQMQVEEVMDKTAVTGGNIYFAPPDYHLLIEDDKTFSMSIDEKVCYSRPSIDVLFKSAADAYGAATLAIILTGANSDGTDGIKYVKDKGGFTIAQNPDTAYAPVMPQSAIGTGKIDKVLALAEIVQFLKAVKSPKS